jgi:S1-C subfamily serine protease
MNKVRKVLSNLIIFMCFSMMLTVPGCDARSSEMLVSAVKEVDYSYLSYRVNSESAKTYAERVSRNSAVQVRIEYPQASIRGSGTYFKFKGHNIVVTAAHLYALGGATVMKSEAMIVTPQEKVIGKLVYLDIISDIAIFKVPTLDSRKPAKFKRTGSYEIGSDVVYSGFPGANSLLTIPGRLSGEGFGTDIAMHSFAWGGSSGSGVFDDNGKFVGVVVSIMVGRGFMGPQLVGSVVYVAPANLIDTVYLRQNLDRLGVTKNAGF